MLENVLSLTPFALLGNIHAYLLPFHSSILEPPLGDNGWGSKRRPTVGFLLELWLGRRQLLELTLAEWAVVGGAFGGYVDELALRWSCRLPRYGRGPVLGWMFYLVKGLAGRGAADVVGPLSGRPMLPLTCRGRRHSTYGMARNSCSRSCRIYGADDRIAACSASRRTSAIELQGERPSVWGYRLRMLVTCCQLSESLLSL
jgi:hypothetical protein